MTCIVTYLLGSLTGFSWLRRVVGQSLSLLKHLECSSMTWGAIKKSR